jgi:hypothetical protein
MWKPGDPFIGDPPHEEHTDQGHRQANPVTSEGRKRHQNQRRADAQVFDRPGYEEELRYDREDVDALEITGLELADVHDGRNSECVRFGRCPRYQHAIQHVVTRLGDDVEHEDQGGDEQEVAVLKHEPERVAPSEGLLVLRRRAPSRVPNLAPVCEVGQDKREDQNARRDKHENERRAQLEQGLRDGGPAHGADRAADTDDGEEAFALFFAIGVGGKAPKLRGGDDVEDAHP